MNAINVTRGAVLRTVAIALALGMTGGLAAGCAPDPVAASGALSTNSTPSAPTAAPPTAPVTAAPVTTPPAPTAKPSGPGLNGLRRGADPHIPYVVAGARTTLHTPSSAITLPATDGTYFAPVNLGEGWLVGCFGNGTCNGSIKVDAHGALAASSSGAHVVDVSSDGSWVAYGWKGKLVRENTRSHVFVSGPAIADLSWIAVWDNGAVTYRDGPKAYLWAASGTVLPRQTQLLDAWGQTAFVIQTVAEGEARNCFRFTPSDSAKPYVETCKVGLRSISPKGDRVFGGAPYTDGFGMGNLVILDRSGATLVDSSRLPGLEDATLADAQWEDNDHVLAYAYDGRWTVVRIGVDGSLERATDLVTAGESDDPFGLGFAIR